MFTITLYTYDCEDEMEFSMKYDMAMEIPLMKMMNESCETDESFISMRAPCPSIFGFEITEAFFKESFIPGKESIDLKEGSDFLKRQRQGKSFGEFSCILFSFYQVCDFFMLEKEGIQYRHIISELENFKDD